ncbi:VOC family protein [Pseudonocardia lacus]|uniref:VOC family protein n=1 Tax=Pseudonocardia lacus TaxID=2835865 RepID=UPI001BDC587D|nr:VOC family protein [Pseudonocardia lacus]
MSIHPTLRYDDPRAAIAFLTDALGFTAEFVSTADDGTVGHAELSFRGGPGDEPGVLMLGPRRRPADPFDTGRAVIYLAADDPDERHRRAVAAGASVVQELVDQPYGSREFAVADPEGNIWSVGTYRPAVKP